MPATTKARQPSSRGTTVSSAPPRPRAQRSAMGDTTRVPEWTTDRWKHRVEAEARNRLKHDLHDVGATRR